MMRTAGGVLLLVALTACGGSNTPTQPQQSSTPAVSSTCSQSVLDHGGGSADPWTIYYDDFSLPESGRLDITVDWTYATSAIAVFVVPANTCGTIEEMNGGQCNLLLRSDPATTPKPRKVSVTLSAGNYRWMIGNASEVQESVSYQLVHSKGSCPAISRGPGASGRPALHFGQIQPMR